MPIIVAESLERVDDPLLITLRPRERSLPRDVLAQIAHGLGRPTDPRPAPLWLRPDQRLACRQLLPVLARYRSALLASPVGSGKTWTALGVATMWDDRPVTVLAPAMLLPQWNRTAKRLGSTIALWSHERLSRGRLPPDLGGGLASSLVIIDESHHFRNPGTRRYHTLAPELIGRAVLLLSATPVVNHLGELAAQLTLGARDDVLVPRGIASLNEYLARASIDPTPLGELIVIGGDRPGEVPSPRGKREKSNHDEESLEGRCRQLEQLAFSRNPATAALIRAVLWKSLASSDAALLSFLRRYRSLLSHARDALAVGRPLSRTLLRSLVGKHPEQLVMWEMIPPAGGGHDLMLEDLPATARLIAEVERLANRPDAKCSRLASLLADGQTTLVFTGSPDTVRHLRHHLGHRVAWCTGDSAGIGSSRMPRDDVLGWFRPGGPLTGGPRVLVTTDVAAEGLDLQQASRVVHYDLPWTAVLLDQRNGRALRGGSRYDQVEVVRFNYPIAIERRLGQLGLLARKRRLPRRVGVGSEGNRAWKWRDQMWTRYAQGYHLRPGHCCVIRSMHPGLLAGVGFFTAEGDRPERLTTLTGFLSPDGSWSEDPALLEARMEEAAGKGPVRWGNPEMESRLSALADVVRQRLKSVQELRWVRRLTPLQSRLLSRLHREAVSAVGARDQRRLEALERAMAFVRRGHTAGETLRLATWMDLPKRAWWNEILRCPDPDGPPSPVACELLGLIVFEAEEA